MDGQLNISRVLKHMDDINRGLVMLTTELTQCIQEARTINTRQVEILEEEQAPAMIAAPAGFEGQGAAEQADEEPTDEEEEKFSENNKPEPAQDELHLRPENSANQPEPSNNQIILEPPQ